MATLILLGCQTVVSKEYPGMDWQYHVKTDKVGEKRGIQWGYLFYKGRELKSYFNTVVIQETRYDFTIKTEETEAGGFWINAKHVTPSLSDEQRISKEEFRRGWYLVFRFHATALMFSYTQSKHLSIDSTVNDIFDRLALSWNRCTSRPQSEENRNSRRLDLGEEGKHRGVPGSPQDVLPDKQIQDLPNP